MPQHATIPSLMESYDCIRPLATIAKNFESGAAAVADGQVANALVSELFES